MIAQILKTIIIVSIRGALGNMIVESYVSIPIKIKNGNEYRLSVYLYLDKFVR